MSNNRYRKKYKAAAHNYAQGIKDNILPIGFCKACEKTLFIYLKSNPENICKYYCENTSCEPGDIRNPKPGDTFFFTPKQVAKVIVDNYGPETINLFSDIQDS